MKKEQGKLTGKNENTTIKPVKQKLEQKETQPTINKKQDSNRLVKTSKISSTKQFNSAASKTPKQNMLQSEKLVRKKSKKNEIREYKPFQVPPDFKLAKKHGLAKKIGKISSYAKYLETGQCCVCCNLPFHKSKFKMEESIDKFASLGSAFTLFFQCNKQMIALLTSYFLIGGLRNLFEVYEACWNQECSSFLGIIYSQNNNTNDTCSSDSYLRNSINFVAFWVLFVGVIVSKIQQDSKNLVLQKNIASHCDFTILVKGVEDTNCEEELKQFLSTRLITGLKLEIAKVNRAYKIQDYFELASEKIKLINKFENLKDKQAEIRRQEQLKQHRNRFFENVTPLIGGKNEKKYLQEKKKLKDLLEQNSKALNLLEEKYADNDGSGIKTELVFVTFEKQQDCISVKKKYVGQRFTNTLLFRNKILTFLPAYEPLDVVWENLEVPNSTKIYRRILFLLLAIMMTAGSLMAVSWVTKWQKQILDQSNTQSSLDIDAEMRNYFLSCLCIIIISVINSLLTITLTTFSQFEKHNTFTSSIISISEKLSWIQFVNTALVPFVVVLVLSPDEQQNQETKNEYLQYVLQDIFFIFIGNVVFAPIVVLLNPEFYVKKIYRWWYQRQGVLCTKTQQQLNEIYEDPEFLIQEYYAILNRIILCSFFYATMLSLGILLNCIAMTGLYWAFKYTFIRRSAYPKCLSSNLHEHMQGILLFTPLIYTLGNLTYGKVFLGCSNSDLFSAFNIIEIIFGFALLAFRSIFVGVLVRFYHKSAYSKSYSNTYSFEKRFMGLSYGQANPITRAFDASGISRMGLVHPETFQRSLIDSNLQQNFEESEKVSDVEGQDNDPIKNPAFRQTLTAAIQAKQLKTSKYEKNFGQEQTKLQLPDDITKSNRIKDISLGKQLSNNNFEEASEKPLTRKSIRKNTKTSIMQYAFTNVLLSRERHNLIISAAFERKEQGKLKEKSEENKEEQDEQEEDDNDEDEDEEDEESNFSLSVQSKSGKQDYEMVDLTK